MSGFATFALSSTTPLRWKRVHPEPPPADLSCAFRLGILRHPKGFKTLIDVPPAPALELHWLPTGLTAGTIIVTRDRKVLTLCAVLSGLDQEDDLMAVMFTAGCLGAFNAAPSFKQMLHFQRPVLALLHRSETGDADAAIASATAALAHAVFSLLGLVEEEEPSTPSSDDDETLER